MDAYSSDALTNRAEMMSEQTSRAETKTRATGRIKLTRRGRFVLGGLAGLAAAAVLASAVLFGSTQAVAAAEAGSQEFEYVIVPPGASLWSVATELDSDADPRDLVAEIVRLNQMDGSGVQAGQPIAVPLRFNGSAGVVSLTELKLKS